MVISSPTGRIKVGLLIKLPFILPLSAAPTAVIIQIATAFKPWNDAQTTPIGFEPLDTAT